MGLPIIRASVNYGIAYNIAWRGEASCSSLISAIELVARMALEDSDVGEGVYCQKKCDRSDR
jgi:4-hydroxy-L-threonine phosphate dehydrogenase PdxA